MLGVVVSVCTPLPTSTQQLLTLLAQQCWELLRPFPSSLRARVLASKILYLVSLTDSFIMLDAKLLKP